MVCPPGTGVGRLEDFSKLGRKSTLRLRIAVSGLFGSSDWSGSCTSRVVADGTGYGLSFALGRLSRVRAKQFIFERRTIKASNDRLHLIYGRRFHKRKAFRLLRLVIANHFHGICDQILRGQPLFDIVRGDPGGQIT